MVIPGPAGLDDVPIVECSPGGVDCGRQDQQRWTAGADDYVTKAVFAMEELCRLPCALLGVHQAWAGAAVARTIVVTLGPCRSPSSPTPSFPKRGGRPAHPHTSGHCWYPAAGTPALVRHADCWLSRGPWATPLQRVPVPFASRRGARRKLEGRSANPPPQIVHRTGPSNPLLTPDSVLLRDRPSGRILRVRCPQCSAGPVQCRRIRRPPVGRPRTGVMYAETKLCTGSRLTGMANDLSDYAVISATCYSTAGRPTA